MYELSRYIYTYTLQLTTEQLEIYTGQTTKRQQRTKAPKIREAIRQEKKKEGNQNTKKKDTSLVLYIRKSGKRRWRKKRQEKATCRIKHFSVEQLAQGEINKEKKALFLFPFFLVTGVRVYSQNNPCFFFLVFTFSCYASDNNL